MLSSLSKPFTRICPIRDPAGVYRCSSLLVAAAFAFSVPQLSVPAFGAEILNITLANGSDNAQVNDGVFNSFSNPVDPVVDNVPPLEGFITAGHLETQLNLAGITLQATSIINVQSPVDASFGDDFALELDAPTINVSPLANIRNDGGITFGNTRAANVVLLDGAMIEFNTSAGGSAINLNGAVSGTALGLAESLRLNSGTGAIVIGGAVSQLTNLTIVNSGFTTFDGPVTVDTLSIANTNGTVAFAESTTITTLLTANQAYNVALRGSTTMVAGEVSFLNTGTVTLGNDAGDSTTFTGGLATTGNATNPSLTNIAGTVATTNMRMDFGEVNFTADATLTSNSTITMGAASGIGGLTKMGTGSMVLGSANSYEGQTKVLQGHLLATNSVGSATGTGSVLVASDGALGGTGIIAGEVSVNSGGVVAPGIATGQLTVDSVVFGGESSLEIELGGLEAGIDFDQLLVNSTAEIYDGAALRISYDGAFTAAPGNKFVILSAASLVGSFDTVIFPDGQSWFVEFDAVRGEVIVGVVPEPSTLVLATTVCLGGFAFLRRRGIRAVGV